MPDRKLWEVFHALGEPTRLKVVKAIAAGGKKEGESVGDLCRMLGIEMVNLSHHLGVLRSAGILESTRHGRFQYYSLDSSLFAVNHGGVVMNCNGCEMRLYELVEAIQGVKA